MHNYFQLKKYIIESLYLYLLKGNLSDCNGNIPQICGINKTVIIGTICSVLILNVRLTIYLQVLWGFFKIFIFLIWCSGIFLYTEIIPLYIFFRITRNDDKSPNNPFLPPYNWNIVECGIKHHNPYTTTISV